MWTALKTVDRRARIVWCVEAIFLSVVLSLFGVVWVGEPRATAPDGLDIPSHSGWGTGVDYLWAKIFNWPYACFSAPLAATIGAWEVALVLQMIADRYDAGIHLANYSPIAKYFVALELVSILDIVGAMMTSFSPGGVWCFDAWYIFLVSVPPSLVTIGTATLAVSRYWTFPFRYASNAMVGFGLGLGISFSMAVCRYHAYRREYLGGAMFSADVVADVAHAGFAMIMWKYLLAAVKVSLSDPTEFKIFRWSLKRIIRGTSAISTAAENADLTIAGIMFFVVSLSTRVYFVWVLVFLITEKAVRL